MQYSINLLSFHHTKSPSAAIPAKRQLARRLRGNVSASTGAIFISYGSEDSEAATRLMAALTADGLDVWLDMSDLRGGDAWDRRIRERINTCRLFVPIISAHTEARDEGYFRREWKLAVDRTHDMAEKKAFLVPG